MLTVNVCIVCTPPHTIIDIVFLKCNQTLKVNSYSQYLQYMQKTFSENRPFFVNRRNFVLLFDYEIT